MKVLLDAGQTVADFDALVREHQSMVFSLAYHVLHDRGLAEEVAQEVFLTLHRNLHSLQSPAHAVFWLRQTTIRRAIDETRRRRRRPQLELEQVPEPAAGNSHRDPMLGDVLRRLIAVLPEDARVVMVMRYQEDLDPSEIAELLDMPLATVKSHLHRSLAVLREKLARRGLGERGNGLAGTGVAARVVAPRTGAGFRRARVGRGPAEACPAVRFDAVAASLLVLTGAAPATAGAKACAPEEQVMLAVRLAGGKLNQVQYRVMEVGR